MKNRGAACDEFLEQIVLRRSPQLRPWHAALFRDHQVEREMKGAVALIVIEVLIAPSVNSGEQFLHVAPVANRDARLADLARGDRRVGVVTVLGGQVEGDRESALAAA